MVTGRQLRITLNEPLSAADVELLFTRDGGSGDNVQRSPHILDLDLDAAKPKFGPDEPVDVTAELTYRGRERSILGGLSVEFRVEQLDGSLSLVPGPAIAVCRNTGALEVGEPHVFPLADAILAHGRVSGIQFDPDPFVLPPGVYYVAARASLVIGGGCGGDSVDLESAILVRVE